MFQKICFIFPHIQPLPYDPVTWSQSSLNINRVETDLRLGRDPNLGRLNSTGPRQMSLDDLFVNVIIVVLKCSVQQHFA